MEVEQENIKVITYTNLLTFETVVQNYLNQGFKVSSTEISTTWYSERFVSNYSVILIKEK